MQCCDFMDQRRAELTARAEASRAAYLCAKQSSQSHLEVLHACEAYEQALTSLSGFLHEGSHGSRPWRVTLTLVSSLAGAYGATAAAPVCNLTNVRPNR
jgi:hypothetical protein